MITNVNAHDFSWLSDPEVFCVNRLDAHSDHRFTVGDDARADRLSLNGAWSFRYAGRPELAPPGFYEDGPPPGGWDEITVPGCVETQGFGVPQYVNVMYPWDGREAIKPPRLPSENPVGCYLRFFDAPEFALGRRTILCFHGVKSAFYVWLNGCFAGYGEDSCTPSEFDVTALLREGENKLAVMVFKSSTGDWLEDQDMWRLFGIFRDVELYSVPDAHARDLFIRQDIDLESGEAVLTADVTLDLRPGSRVALEAELYDADGAAVASCGLPEVTGEAEIRLRVGGAKLWSAERPYLYTLRLCLRGGDGVLIETVTQPVGFRRFEMRNGVMCLNGRRVVFRGVNRHEFNCRSGRTVTMEDMLWDVRTMKSANINAVRTSHYPNRSEFYRLCDEYGLYVIDEMNLETHGTWQKLGDIAPDENTLPDGNPLWREAVLDRARSMLERDKNHPCVLMWSCGNEAFGGETLSLTADFFRERDPSRLVHYEGIHNDRRYPGTSDMESRMYARVDEIAAYLESGPDKPFMLCEYSHAMGNSCGNLFKYTEMEEKYAKYQGGFIWDFIDQAILNTRDGRPYLASGGDFGDRPNDGYFCGDGIVFADRTPSPKLQEVKYLYQGLCFEPTRDGVFIKNRYLFLNSSEFDLRYSVLLDGEVLCFGEFSTEVQPGAREFVSLPLPSFGSEGEYAVRVSAFLRQDTAWNIKGYEVAFGQSVFGKPARKPVSNNWDIIDGDSNYGIAGAGARMLVSKAFGGLYSIEREGRQLLTAPFRPDFWRAPTSNDAGNGSVRRWARWKTASLYALPIERTLSRADGGGIIRLLYSLGTSPDAECAMSFDFSSRGRGRISMSMPWKDWMDDLPAFGFSFKMPREFSRFRWYGNGPDECYADRDKGARLDIFEINASENVTPYLKPQECGNRTGVRWAEIIDAEGRGLRFSSETPFEISVLPYTSHELENAAHLRDLPDANHTVVCIAKAKCGVGGDDGWGAPVHPEFLVDRRLELDFSVDVDIL